MVRRNPGDVMRTDMRARPWVIERESSGRDSSWKSCANSSSTVWVRLLRKGTLLAINHA